MRAYKGILHGRCLAQCLVPEAHPQSLLLITVVLTDSCGIATWPQAPAGVWGGSSLALVHSSQSFLCSCSPGQRTDEELDLIFEELLHIKAVAHLSNSVKRELAAVLLFEPHSKAGTVCKSGWPPCLEPRGQRWVVGGDKSDWCFCQCSARGTRVPRGTLSGRDLSMW